MKYHHGQSRHDLPFRNPISKVIFVMMTIALSSSSAFADSFCRDWTWDNSPFVLQPPSLIKELNEKQKKLNNIGNLSEEEIASVLRRHNSEVAAAYCEQHQKDCTSKNCRTITNCSIGSDGFVGELNTDLLNGAIRENNLDQVLNEINRWATLPKIQKVCCSNEAQKPVECFQSTNKPFNKAMKEYHKKVIEVRDAEKRVKDLVRQQVTCTPAERPGIERDINNLMQSILVIKERDSNLDPNHPGVQAAQLADKPKEKVAERNGWGEDIMTAAKMATLPYIDVGQLATAVSSLSLTASTTKVVPWLDRFLKYLIALRMNWDFENYNINKDELEKNDPDVEAMIEDLNNEVEIHRAGLKSEQLNYFATIKKDLEESIKAIKSKKTATSKSTSSILRVSDIRSDENTKKNLEHYVQAVQLIGTKVQIPEAKLANFDKYISVHKELKKYLREKATGIIRHTTQSRLAKHPPYADFLFSEPGTFKTSGLVDTSTVIGSPSCIINARSLRSEKYNGKPFDQRLQLEIKRCLSTALRTKIDGRYNFDGSIVLDDLDEILNNELNPNKLKKDKLKKKDSVSAASLMPGQSPLTLNWTLKLRKNGKSF